jgi:phosphopantothenoylcysteine synthetase/decarboxylase
MRLLVTAGNTQIAIDRVRCITNIFTGRTGAQIACRAHERGHTVTLLTSQPERVAENWPATPGERWTVVSYITYDDLAKHLERLVCHSNFDAIVHCAAVSDYRATGVFAPAPGTHFDAEGQWCSENLTAPALLDRASGKIKSNDPELWIRLVRTPKLIDQFRKAWQFRGIVVKFKLEVGLDEAPLLELAERSRTQSEADLMVANTLEGAAQCAYLGPVQNRYERINRADLATRIIVEVESIQRVKRHG